MIEFDPDATFAVFATQDSGCVGYGVETDGHRWFVKTARTSAGQASLRRAMVVHAAVHHDVIVAPVATDDGDGGPVIVYPWREGVVLNQATVTSSDRSALARFQCLPRPEVESAIGAVLDAHLTVADAGFVSVDLYDGCFLYDFGARRLHLVDLDEYRPGPFVLDADRLPGSLRYMAPEELTRGARIDERTMVFTLGRTIHHLLDGPAGWRGTPAQRAVADAAARRDPDDRIPDVGSLLTAWRSARD